MSIELTIGFSQTVMTVSEDAGDITVSIGVVGRTAVPITVDVVFSGTARESEG